MFYCMRVACDSNRTLVFLFCTAPIASYLGVLLFKILCYHILDVILFKIFCISYFSFVLRRRTRAIFEVALKVHLNIQQRDLEVGRSLGNWILRYLDKMKPSAQIRSHSAAKLPSSVSASTTMTEQLPNSSHRKTTGNFQKFRTGGDIESDRHLFTSSRNMWPKPFPTIAMMMRPAKPAGTNIQHRHLCFSGPDVSRLSQGRGGFEGVIRKDIMQWMVRN